MVTNSDWLKTNEEDMFTSTFKTDEIFNLNSQKKAKLYYKIFNELNATGSNKEIFDNFNEKFKQYIAISDNKTIFNKFLKEKRKKREDEMHEKDDDLHDDYIRNEKLVHIEEFLGQHFNKDSRLQMPISQEKLWVTKVIGNHEPSFDVFKNDKDNYDFNSENGPSKPTKESIQKKKNRKVLAECKLKLSGEDLQKIHVGPKEVNFGQIFRNSKKNKTFWIKNNLKTAIFVKLDEDMSSLLKETLSIK